MQPEAAPLNALDAWACSWASTWTETRATSAWAELQRRRPPHVAETQSRGGLSTRISREINET
jgi:hypothetical protein